VTPVVIGIAGYKNAGKTTLVTRLVEALCARGHAVSTVKHAHHAFDIDQPGRDSYLHRQAGAREVAVVSGERWALMHELKDEAEPDLDDILARLAPCDIVMVEGYKMGGHDKIEVRGEATGRAPLWPEDKSVVAIVSAQKTRAEVPVFGRDEIGRIVDFIERKYRPGDGA
jgi:molybdopterin-guanine dinucleotide biosynthesis protein B